MHKFSIEKNLNKKLKKISKKDKKKFNSIFKKIDEIINTSNVEHYKNLKYPMQEFKRVHIDKSFVLIFKFDKKANKIFFYDFDHYDKIYK